MRHTALANDSMMENLHNAFTMETIVAHKKAQKVKKNMECRRKLELRMEEQRLKRETCEFEFELM